MIFSCPTCTQPIGAVHINNRTGLAECPTCHCRYDPVRVDDEYLFPPSFSNIDIYETGNQQIEIVLPPQQNYLHIATKAATGLVMLGIIAPVLKEPEILDFLSTRMIYFTGLLLLIGIWSLYSAFNEFVGSQKIIVDQQNITVISDRLFFPRKKSLPLKDIIAMKTEDKFFFRNRLLIEAVPVIHTRNDQAYLFEFAHPEEVQWLFRTLGLMIEDRTEEII